MLAPAALLFLVPAMDAAASAAAAATTGARMRCGHRCGQRRLVVRQSLKGTDAYFARPLSRLVSGPHPLNGEVSPRERVVVGLEPARRHQRMRPRADLEGMNAVSSITEHRGQLLAGAGLLGLGSLMFQAFMASQKEPKEYRRSKLSATPIFTVTQRTGEYPYMTEIDEDGSRIGYFFTEKEDANAVLEDVRANVDPTARISSFPLKKVLELLDLDEIRAGGKFRLKSSKAQLEHADRILQSQGKSSFDRAHQASVPVFYDRRLISVLDEEPTLMAFLKLEDMEKTWDSVIKETRKTKKPKGFGTQDSQRDDKSLVNVALTTEKDNRLLEPEIMDLMAYLETVENNSDGAKSIMISSEQFL